ncbi:MAG TPA: hypothetical protein VF134_01795, partial [Candidatus Dormibacteraeota bacterium]
MRALRLQPGELTAKAIEGRVLTHDLGRDLRKGTVLTAAHLDRLRELPEIHVAELEARDVHEDEAGV